MKQYIRGSETQFKLMKSLPKETSETSMFQGNMTLAKQNVRNTGEW